MQRYRTDYDIDVAPILPMLIHVQSEGTSANWLCNYEQELLFRTTSHHNSLYTAGLTFTPTA